MSSFGRVCWSRTRKFLYGLHRKYKDDELSDDNGDNSSKSSKCNCALWLVARVFSRRPFVVLFLTLTLGSVLTKFGISDYGFPEFDDPYLGFETRFTSVAGKLIALENLRKEVNRLEILENYPGEKLTGREWRRKRQLDNTDSDTFIEEDGDGDDEETFDSGGGYCPRSPLEDYSRVALEIESGNDIFSKEVLMLICYFEKLLEVIPEYNRACEHDGDRNCCRMWSLPGYVAEYSNKTDCSAILDTDIQLFREDLAFCRTLFDTKEKYEACTLKHELCPAKCQREGVLHSVIFYVVDNGYAMDEEVRYTMMVIPVPKAQGSRARYTYLQSRITNLQLPKSTVRLAGFDFGDKDLTFKKYLISDLLYVLIGSVVIFGIVWFYTCSFTVTCVAFLVQVLSLGISYFLYNAVFKIPYFPFMNMLVTIIMMGIGTDGTLILGSQWHRLRSENKDIKMETRTWDKMMFQLLQETTAPLFVTTCTTAGAFFASLTSSITTIKCFSIFAGTSTIVGFILLYLCVPTTLLLSDLCVSYLKSVFNDKGAETGKVWTKVLKIYISVKTFFHVKPPKCFKWGKINRTLLWVVSFLVLLSILIWSTLIVFYNPGYELPNSEQFQLLSTNHPIEKFDKEVEPRFSTSLMASSPGDSYDEKLTVYFIWGVNPTDTGFSLDPNDNGKLLFNSDFSMSDHKSQKWMRKFCNKLTKQSFYDEVANKVVGVHYDSCFMDTMIKWMKRDCEHVFFKNVTYKPCCKVSKFPYEPEVFTKCVENAARDVYRTPSQYFQPDIAGPKFLVLREDNSTERSGQLATFTLRIKTNATYSLSYQKMRAFYDDLQQFFDEQINSEKVPNGLSKGFFISAHLDFFDLQTSLLNDTWASVLISTALCFIFLWVFSRDFFIAVGAVLCIFSIVIVSSAVLIQLFNWKLGVFESIAVTVAVGLSDFTAHHALEYSKRRSVLQMTSATFASAITTITIGLSMFLFSNVLVYQQIGSFFFVLIIVSWIYSVLFLSPILEFFDKVRDFFTATCRLYFMDNPCSSVSATNSTIYFNPMVNDRIKRGGMRNLSNAADVNASDDCDLDLEEKDSLSPSEVPQVKQRAIVEKVKLLKKLATETSV